MKVKVPILGTPEYRYMNALKWIRCIAFMHYFGDAFDPEHMRGIANIAAEAMIGRREMPDFDESMEKAQKKARKWAHKMQGLFDYEDEDEGQA